MRLQLLLRRGIARLFGTRLFYPTVIRRRRRHGGSLAAVRYTKGKYPKDRHNAGQMTSIEAKIGTLWKQEPGFLPEARKWKRRSLLLDGNALYCFRRAPDLAPQGRILMADAQLQVDRTALTLPSP